MFRISVLHFIKIIRLKNNFHNKNLNLKFTVSHMHIYYN